MKCKKCGREAPAESAFCPACGASFGAESTDDSGPRVKMPGHGRSAPPPEEDLWAGSYSPKAMAGQVIVAAALTLVGAIGAAIAGPPGWLVFFAAAVLVWGALALVYLYRRFTVRYRLSNYRFFHDSGLLSRVGNRVEVIDIDDVTVRQGLIERIFDVGSINIRSSDTTHPELSLPGIEGARQVADMIDGARRAERQRRGFHLDAPLEI